MKQIRILFVASCVALTGIVSCSNDEAFFNNDSSTQAITGFEKRFSQNDIQKIYIDNPDTKRQTALTVTKFLANAASQAFVQEWGSSFSHGVEVRAFFNTRDVNSSAAPLSEKNMISALERVSTWKTVRGSDGNLVLDESSTIDASGRLVADKSDGVINNGQENVLGMGSFHFPPLSPKANLLLVLTSGLPDMRFVASLENTTGISIFPLGTLLPVKGIRLKLEVYPYETGWLVYAAGAMKLDRAPDANRPAGMGPAMVNWLREKSLGRL